MHESFGKYSVEITQDRRRILIPEHAQKQVEFAIKEKMGQFAWETANIQYRCPDAHKIVTTASAYILTAEEMTTMLLKMAELQEEVAWYKRQYERRMTHE